MSISKVAEPGTRNLQLHIYTDRSTVEIFADHGKRVLTMLTYAAMDQTGVEFFSQRGKAKPDMRAWRLRSTTPGITQPEE